MNKIKILRIKSFWREAVRNHCLAKKPFYYCDRCKKCKKIAYDLYFCPKIGFFSEHFRNYMRIREDEEFFFYHGTNLENLRKIQKDGFLKPSSETRNAMYDVSYKDSIYFSYNIKNALEWILYGKKVIIRVKREKLKGKIISDDISEGIRLITKKQGDLEFSLDEGKTFRKIVKRKR